MQCRGGRVMPELPWSEKLNLFQIHPEAATLDDIATMAELLSNLPLDLEEEGDIYV